MPKFEVPITCRSTSTYIVEADTADEAVEAALYQFNQRFPAQNRRQSLEEIGEPKVVLEAVELKSLPVGGLFRVSPDGPEYEYRGNGWYDSVGGYGGGPWHRYDNPIVWRAG